MIIRAKNSRVALAESLGAAGGVVLLSMRSLADVVAGGSAAAASVVAVVK